jgi:hypothetical protein
MSVIDRRLVEVKDVTWWESRWFAAALIFLSAVPLLYPEFPPLVDLPSHIGRYKIAMGDSALLGRYYSFEWHLSGNLGADLLIVPLSHLVGPIAATKFVTMLIPPAIVAGSLAISKAANGRYSPTAAMAVPLAYSEPFLYGFLNYILAIALALWIFYLFLRLGQAGRLKLRAALMVPLSSALFMTHVSGWGILGLIAFASEWVRLRGEGLRPFEAIGKAAIQMIPLVLPLALLLLWQSGAAGTTRDWFQWRRKLLWMALLFRDQWLSADRYSVIFLYALAFLTLILRSCRLHPALGLGAAAVFSAFLVLPYTIFGSAQSDVRLLPVALILLFMAVRPFPLADRRAGQLLAVAATAFALVRITLVTASFAVAADRQQSQLSVLDEVERGARIAVAAGEHCKFWPLPRSDHLGSMAIIRKEAFVNDQWFLPGSVSLVVNYPQAGAYASDPSQMLPYDLCGPPAVRQWIAGLPPKAFDYVWLLDTFPLPPSYSDRWRLVAERPGSRLYRKVKA